MLPGGAIASLPTRSGDTYVGGREPVRANWPPATPAAMNSASQEEIMANSAQRGASDFNTKIIEEFRANQGHVGGFLAGTPMILIHHIGARSGIERVTPLACNPQPDGRFAIVASNG